MSTARVLGALSLLSLVACDGPTLSAGSYLLEPDASSVSDARVNEDADADEDPPDAEVDAEDAGRPRDAGRGDDGGWRYPFPEERHRCMNSSQCDDNRFNLVCDQGGCVECTNNQHCERFQFGLRCNEMRGICFDPDRPRP